FTAEDAKDAEKRGRKGVENPGVRPWVRLVCTAGDAGKEKEELTAEDAEDAEKKLGRLSFGLRLRSRSLRPLPFPPDAREDAGAPALVLVTTIASRWRVDAPLRRRHRLRLHHEFSSASPLRIANSSPGFRESPAELLLPDLPWPVRWPAGLGKRWGY